MQQTWISNAHAVLCKGREGRSLLDSPIVFEIGEKVVFVETTALVSERRREQAGIRNESVANLQGARESKRKARRGKDVPTHSPIGS